MAIKGSVYDDAINVVRADIQFARSQPAQVPVGHEEVSKRDARSRFMQMTPEERKQAIEENGKDSTIDMLRPQGGLPSFGGPEEPGAAPGAPQQPPLPLAPPQQGMNI